MAPPSIRIPDGFVEELKARIRPSDVIGRKVKLTKKGKEWVGLSPFTNEKSPSFYVNDQKRIFKDFSSGIGGDVISFVMETERLSFMEAVEKLAEEAGMQSDLVEHLLGTETDLDKVEAQIANAQKSGITGVPCFIIDGRFVLAGAEKPETIAAALLHADETRTDPQAAVSN